MVRDILYWPEAALIDIFPVAMLPLKKSFWLLILLSPKATCLKSRNRIVGGTFVPPSSNDFPYHVQIAEFDGLITPVDPECGGTLISLKYGESSYF